MPWNDGGYVLLSGGFYRILTVDGNRKPVDARDGEEERRHNVREAGRRERSTCEVYLQIAHAEDYAFKSTSKVVSTTLSANKLCDSSCGYSLIPTFPSLTDMASTFPWIMISMLLAQ
jgi:hypothetical protein